MSTNTLISKIYQVETNVDKHKHWYKKRHALVFMLASRPSWRNKSCYAYICACAYACVASEKQIMKLPKTSGCTWLRAWENITVFKNVQKCQYDSVKILCFRNWRNPGISSAISVHKRLSIVYNILLYDKNREKFEKRFQFLSRLRASSPFRRSPLRESEKVSQKKNVSAPREV